MTLTAVFGGLALANLAAPSEAPATTLGWRAPAGCPTQDELAATLATQVAATGGTPVPLSIDAVVRPTADARWHLSITIVSDEGEQHRELDLDSCAAAAEAVALVHGLALSRRDAPPPEVPTLELPLPESPRLPAPTPPPAAVPEHARDEPRPPAVPRRRDRRPQLVMHVDGGGGIGTIARGGGHLMFGVGPAWRRVQFGLRLDHTIVRRVDREADGIGARISSTTGGLELELPIRRGRFTLLPGVELRAGGIRARGVGGRDPVTRWVPWVVAAAGFGFVWEATRVIGLRVAAAVEVPLARHTFVFDDLELDRTGRIGGRLVLGVAIRVPRRSR